MQGDTAISNHENIIDSRDIIARIGYITAADCQDDEAADGCDMAGDCPRCYGEAAEELAVLTALADEGIAEWEDGATLIRDSYFTEYAEELAGDIGYIDREAGWPLNHIDWEAAADELKIDYMSVDFDGAEYWARA